MKIILEITLILGLFGILLPDYCQEEKQASVTVPFSLDHNRMIVEAEIQRADGIWQRVRLWVDSGSPNFIISESLANLLGIDISVEKKASTTISNIDVPPPSHIRVGGMELNFKGVQSKVMLQPFWLFTATHNDGNLPSTVLQKYHVVFDYSKRQLTIAEPGSIKPKGNPTPASINRANGIIQIDAVIEGENMSFALDNGASYSFLSEDKLAKISGLHYEWPRMTGALGCANMWGWWPPDEQNFQVVRVPIIKWGQEQLSNVGLVGVPVFPQTGLTLGAWYSRKTTRPVDGFIGPNALKSYRVEIDYANSIVYFEKSTAVIPAEMDLVGLTLRPLEDSTYQVIGVAQKNKQPAVEGVEPGDILMAIGDMKIKGLTMGAVIDALRGKPGEIKIIFFNRKGKQFKIEAKVKHFL